MRQGWNPWCYDMWYGDTADGWCSHDRPYPHPKSWADEDFEQAARNLAVPIQWAWETVIEARLKGGKR